MISATLLSGVFFTLSDRKGGEMLQIQISLGQKAVVQVIFAAN
jgi:hypothetical protein